MKTHPVLLTAVLALGFAACSPKAIEAAAPATPAAAPPAAAPPAAMADMKMDTPPAAPAGKVMGEGKIAAVDPAAGSIKLDHGPIAALSWPAMSMTFTAADPKMLAGLKVGDTVTFEVKSTTESTIVTMVQKK